MMEIWFSAALEDSFILSKVHTIFSHMRRYRYGVMADSFILGHLFLYVAMLANFFSEKKRRREVLFIFIISSVLSYLSFRSLY